jgi:hypothetical protein
MTMETVMKQPHEEVRATVMEDFLAQVDAAIIACTAAADELRRQPSEQTAELACLACRNAVQLFFFARSDFGSEINEKAQPLAQSLRQTREILQRLFDERQSQEVGDYLSNVVRREKLVSALTGNDPTAVKRFLKQELASCS